MPFTRCRNGAVAEQTGGRGLVREGVDELLGRPGGGGMLGDVEVDDAPAVVSEHNENEEDAETGRSRSRWSRSVITSRDCGRTRPANQGLTGGRRFDEGRLAPLLDRRLAQTGAFA